MSQILKYIGYTKPSLAMYVLHNLHGQLSQYHDFMFSLSGDREGAWLISVGTKFHNRSAYLKCTHFLLSFFSICNVFGNAFGYSLFSGLEK